MKKMIWFTKEQSEMLELIKLLTGQNNSEIVREAMKVYLDLIKKEKGL
jgi:hypothetical protein